MIGILCSGVGLGHYVPGLLLQRELAAAGIDSRVLVFERFLGDEQRHALTQARTAYQRNAALVHIGRNVLLKLKPRAAAAAGQPFEGMDVAAFDRFAVISGFWIPALVELQHRCSVDVVHIDSVASPSWEAVRDGIEALHAQEFWFSHYAAGRMDHRIDVACDVVPFAQRKNAVLAHGGGWAVGAYKDAAARIAEAKYDVEVIVPAAAEAPSWASTTHRIDPSWEAWSESGAGTFPPLAGAAPRHDRAYHDVLEVARQVVAVVSKPGGATIFDCMAAATPLVYAEPVGEHEARNAELWTALGFAISLEEWARSGFASEALEPLHASLLRARAELPTYVQQIMVAAA